MTKVLRVTIKRRRDASTPDSKPPISVMVTPYAEKRLRTVYQGALAENQADANLWSRTVRDAIARLEKTASNYPVARESRLLGLELRELALRDLALRILFRIEKASIQVLDVQSHQTDCRGA